MDKVKKRDRLAMNADKFIISGGQCHGLELAGQACGATSEFTEWLRTKENLSRVVDVWRGNAEIKQVEYLVDFDAKPFTPNGLTILPDSEQLAKRVRGKWKFDPTKVKLYLDEEQEDDKCIKGTDLRKKLKTKDVFNANLLDFYLAHPELIPESWKGKTIFFWGTIYRDTAGNLYVRYLSWTGDGWHWNYRWLGGGWNSYHPSAVLGK